MKKYIYTAVILVGFVLTTSCEDFLTTDNKSNVTDKEYFSTKTGFESLVSNAYSTLRDVYAVSSYTTYFNAGTDMYDKTDFFATFTCPKQRHVVWFDLCPFVHHVVGKVEIFWYDKLQMLLEVLL